MPSTSHKSQVNFSIMFSIPSALLVPALHLHTKGHSKTMWTKFYPILTPYPLEWKKMDILYTRYLPLPPPDVLSTDLPPPFLVHVVIEWPLKLRRDPLLPQNSTKGSWFPPRQRYIHPLVIFTVLLQPFVLQKSMNESLFVWNPPFSKHTPAISFILIS